MRASLAFPFSTTPLEAACTIPKRRQRHAWTRRCCDRPRRTAAHREGILLLDRRTGAAQSFLLKDLGRQDRGGILPRASQEIRFQECHRDWFCNVYRSRQETPFLLEHTSEPQHSSWSNDHSAVVASF